MRAKFVVLEVQTQSFATKAGGKREQQVAVMQDVSPDPTIQLFEWVFGEHKPAAGQQIEVRIIQIEGWFNGRARIQCVPIQSAK